MAYTIDDIEGDVRDIKVIKWPGTDKDVGIMLLRCNELQEAHFDAREWFRKKAQKTDDTSHIQFLVEEEVRQCLRFLIDPESKKAEYKIFANPDIARKRLTQAKRVYLVDQYNVFQTEIIESWGLDTVEEKEE